MSVSKRSASRPHAAAASCQHARALAATYIDVQAPTLRIFPACNYHRRASAHRASTLKRHALLLFMAQPQDALCLTLLHQQAPESALPQGCAARPALAEANASRLVAVAHSLIKCSSSCLPSSAQPELRDNTTRSADMHEASLAQPHSAHCFALPQHPLQHKLAATTSCKRAQVM